MSSRTYKSKAPLCVFAGNGAHTAEASVPTGQPQVPVPPAASRGGGAAAHQGQQGAQCGDRGGPGARESREGTPRGGAHPRHRAARAPPGLLPVPSLPSNLLLLICATNTSSRHGSTYTVATCSCVTVALHVVHGKVHMLAIRPNGA
jgi:hypothetical protein